MFGTLRLCKGHDERPRVCGGGLSKDVRVTRGAAALCWAGCPGCPDALHLQGQHFPAAPLATLLTGCLEQKVEPVFPLLPLTIMSVKRRVVWCPQIHRGISLEGTLCGRKRLRLRLLTARRRASSLSLAGGTFCVTFSAFVITRHTPRGVCTLPKEATITASCISFF